MNLDFIRADRPSFLLPVPPPPRQSSSPSCSPILFAKLLPILVASFRAQWALLDLNCQRPISVGTAGPQRPASASGLSGHRWTSALTSTATARSQWALPDQKICQIKCQKICQKDCQKICQKNARKKERRYARQKVRRYARKKKEHQKECQKIWQKEFSNI